MDKDDLLRLAAFGMFLGAILVLVGHPIIGAALMIIAWVKVNEKDDKY